MNGNIQQTEDMEISLKDLFGVFLRRWKTILLGGIFVALIVGAYELYRVNKPEEDVAYEDLIEELELTPLEVDTVSDYANQYKLLDANIESLVDYCKYGSVMTLDPQNVVQYNVLYMLKTDLNNLGNAFSWRIFTDEDYTTIRQILGLETEYYDLQQQVRFSVSMIGGPSVDLEQDGAETILDSWLMATTGIDYSGILTITTYASSVEQAESLAELAEKAIDRYASNLTDTGAYLTLEHLNTSYMQEWNETIDTLQQEKQNELKDQIASRTSFNKNYVSLLSTEQKELYNFLVYTDSEEEIESSKNISKKLIIVGFVLGVFVMLCWYASKYIFSDTIKTENELLRMTGILLTGKVKNKKKNSRDGINVSNNIDMVTMRVASIMEKTKSTKAFVFDGQSAVNQALVRSIQERLSADGMQVVSGNALVDPEIYKELKKCELVFAVVNLKITTRRELTEFVEMCHEIDIPVVGQIVMEDI